jgi:hypothetical protein
MEIWCIVEAKGHLEIRPMAIRIAKLQNILLGKTCQSYHWHVNWLIGQQVNQLAVISQIITRWHTSTS